MQFSVRLVSVYLFLAVFIIFLAGCGGSMGPPRSSGSHLYVGDNATPGQVLQFTLPLTNSSTASVTLSNSATNNIVGLAVDSSGNLATGDSAGHLTIYNAPIGNSSTAAASFSNGSAGSSGQLVFDSAGHLFTATGTLNVNIFNPPLTSASVPVTVETIGGLSFVTGAALDGSGNLIVANGGTGTSKLAAFPPAGPLVTPAVASALYRQLAVSNSQVFVANMASTTGQIDVYNLPLSSSSTPAFSITNVNLPTSVAFDGNGNLYVGNAGDHTIRVFRPPFSASSTASVTLALSSTFDIEALAIGK
jgi:hypothetical protein